MTEASLGLFQLKNIPHKIPITDDTWVIPVIGPDISSGSINIEQYRDNLAFINEAYAKDPQKVPPNWYETDGITRFFIDEIIDQNNTPDAGSFSFSDVDGKACKVDERVIDRSYLESYKRHGNIGPKLFQDIYDTGGTKLHAGECGRASRIKSGSATQCQGYQMILLEQASCWSRTGTQ